QPGADLGTLTPPGSGILPLQSGSGEVRVLTNQPVEYEQASWCCVARPRLRALLTLAWAVLLTLPRATAASTDPAFTSPVSGSHAPVTRDLMMTPERLEKGPGGLLFHVSWGGGREYRRAHIPGAFHFDTNRIEEAPLWRLVSDAELEKALLALGVTR